MWSIGNRKNARLKFPSLCRSVVRQTGAALIYESAVILVFHCCVSTHSVCLHYCPVKYLSEKRWKQEAPGWKFQQFDQLVLLVGQSVNVLAAVLSWRDTEEKKETTVNEVLTSHRAARSDQFSTIQDSAYAFGKDRMHSIPSLGSLWLGSVLAFVVVSVCDVFRALINSFVC